MKFYTYFRSSAAYRVRIALNLKNIAVENGYVNLRTGAQHAPEFKRVNAQELVPALVDDDHTLPQSMAIIEYLDENYPEPPLLPRDSLGRARVRSLAQVVACDIHPINNVRVLQYLTTVFKVDQEARNTWYRHWVRIGLEALEARLANEGATGRFCHGDTPTLADCCLVPQLFNARRFDVDLAPYPTLVRIEAECNVLQAFADAAPERQGDRIEEWQRGRIQSEFSLHARHFILRD